MLDRIIKKDWGLMLPVNDYDSDGNVIENQCRYIARVDDTDIGWRRTSIHRHECDSTITVICGCVSVYFSEGKGFVFSCGESVTIPSGEWHRVEFHDNDTILLEEYDHVGDTYPIERYEGEGWPDE